MIFATEHGGHGGGTENTGSNFLGGKVFRKNFVVSVCSALPVISVLCSEVLVCVLELGDTMLNRRQFLEASAIVTAGTVLCVNDLSAAMQSLGTKWPIGCFNRPWTRWTYDEGLDGIKAAG